jgi:hypothetical protein
MDLNLYTRADAEEAAETIKSDPAPASEIADPDKVTKSGDTLTKDDLYSKVLKFVPAPLIGIYLFATNLVVAQAGKDEQPDEITLWIILGVFLAATIGYLVVRKVKRFFQIALSAAAFLAFATASPGPFQQIEGWNELWGSLALIGVALLIVVFKPKAIPDN